MGFPEKLIDDARQEKSNNCVFTKENNPKEYSGLEKRNKTRPYNKNEC